MDSLGALVGSDDVATSKWALEKAQSHDQLFAALLHPALPVQHAMGILRFCAIPRMNYLTRVVRPDLLRPACEYFDRKVFETALTKLGLPSTLTDEAHTLLTQPIPPWRFWSTSDGQSFSSSLLELCKPGGT